MSNIKIDKQINTYGNKKKRLGEQINKIIYSRLGGFVGPKDLRLSSQGGPQVSDRVRPEQ